MCNYSIEEVRSQEDELLLVGKWEESVTLTEKSGAVARKWREAMSEMLFIALGVVGAVFMLAISVIAIIVERNAEPGAEGERSAGLLIRLSAWTIDTTVVNVSLALAMFLVAVLEAAGLVRGWAWWALVVSLIIPIYVVYFSWLTAKNGQTWGKRAAGVIVESASGGRVGLGRAAVRILTTLVFIGLQKILIGFLDLLVMAVNRQKRSLHDLVAGTAVRRTGASPGALLPMLAVVGWVLPFVLVFGIVRPFFVQAFYVPTVSMAPTLGKNDHFLVNKLAYRIGKVKMGDIVVFKAPASAMQGERDIRPVTLIKRVVALPGDAVQVRGGDGVYVNGRRVEATYWVDKPKSNSIGTYGISKPYRVPSGCCFVVGDNINQSWDSRHWGPLPLRNVVGKATVRFWPAERIGNL